MATLTGALVALLQADAPLAADLVGGVWDRPLAPDYGALGILETATPGAFAPSSAGTSVQVRPSAVVLVEDLAPFGLTGGRPPAAGYAWTVSIWLYQARGDRSIISRAGDRLLALLDGAAVQTDDGSPVLRLLGRFGAAGGTDDDLVAEVDRVQFRAALAAHWRA